MVQPWHTFASGVFFYLEGIQSVYSLYSIKLIIADRIVYVAGVHVITELYV